MIQLSVQNADGSSRCSKVNFLTALNVTRPGTFVLSEDCMTLTLFLSLGAEALPQKTWLKAVAADVS